MEVPFIPDFLEFRYCYSIYHFLMFRFGLNSVRNGILVRAVMTAQLKAKFSASDRPHPTQPPKLHPRNEKGDRIQITIAFLTNYLTQPITKQQLKDHSLLQFAIAG